MRTGRMMAGVVAGFLLAGAAMAAKTNYVSLAGTQTASPYTSWSLATTNIQDAINDTVDNDTVLVSNGTYYITNQISLTNVITMISLWGASSTIVARAASGTNAPQHRIFDITTNATLGGFTAQNGYLTDGAGAGIYILKGTVQNCIIFSNTCYGSGFGTAQGAGVNISNGTLQNCTIISNSGSANNGTLGGGVCIARNSGGLVRSNTISYNTGQCGGGLYSRNPTAGADVIQDCVFEYNGINGAGQAGTAVYLDDGNPTISNCVFRFNAYSASTPGAISKGGNGSLTVLDCTIVSNKCPGIITALPCTVKRCIISGNSNNVASGFSVTPGVVQTFENCRITDNFGTNATLLRTGSGNSATTFRNCTIAVNQPYGIVTPYGIVIDNPTNLVFQNTIVYNFATNIYSADSSVLACALTNCFTNSCSPQLTEPGFSNVTGDPLFLSPAAGDYHFKKASPCTGTGTTNVLSIYTSDIEKVLWGNTVNMGCYKTLIFTKGAIFTIR